VRAAHKAGIAVAMITQDLGQARRMADEIVFMHHGRIRECTPSQDFFRTPRSSEAAAFLNGEIVL
jgi:tungstate transport system ATP-binding protein